MKGSNTFNKFPIPDWEEDVFKYPGTIISKDTVIKPNKKKRKGDNGDINNTESHEGKTKKRKVEKDDKTLNTTKEQKTTQTTKNNINNQDVSTVKKKRKRNKKNNKYKELNERQQQERESKDGIVVGEGDGNQENQTVMQVEKTQQQLNGHKLTKKKKKSKLLNKENNMQEKPTIKSAEMTVTKDKETLSAKSESTKKKKKRNEMHLNKSHDNFTTNKEQNASQHNNIEEIDQGETPPHSQTKKKKKTTKKHTDTNISNGKKLNMEKPKKNNKTNNKNMGLKSIEETDNLETPLTNEPKMDSKEKPLKVKEKKRKETTKLINGKDKKTKPAKLKTENKSSKRVMMEEEEDDEEEILFDGYEEDCSEGLKDDLNTLLSSLDFGNLKTKGSRKRRGNEDDSDVEINTEGKLVDTDSENKGLEEGTKKKKKKKNKKKVEEENMIQKNIESTSKKEYDATVNQNPSPAAKKSSKFDRKKVAQLLEDAARMEREKPSPPKGNSLKEKMEGRLMAARFRMVNQDLYTKSSTEAKELFRKDRAAFDIYHQGYRAQVKQWPVNPLDIIIKWLSNRDKELVVADMGCGEGLLSQRVPQKSVHSLDLVASNPWVTPCDMAHTPLGTGSVDVVVFCLSLMGTNIKDFMAEANRVLKPGGIMKVAEVNSRFDDVKEFEKQLIKYGFHCTSRDTSHKYFFISDFKKTRNLKKTVTLPDINLKPCMYKKR